MIKLKKFYILLVAILFINSCNTMSDAGKVLRNEKLKTTDEFLVKKREPLVLPPDYNEIPSPRSAQEEKISKGEKTIKEILNVSKDTNNSNEKSSSVEESILKKIRK